VAAVSADAPGRSVDLTEGDLLKPLVVLAAPIVASQMMQVTYNLADTFWVGRLGQEAVSAISFSFPLVFFLVGLGGGFAGVGTVLVSQHRGAGNDEAVDRVAGETIAFVFLFSVALSAVGYLSAPFLLSAIGTTPGTTVHRLAVTYTRTIMLGVYAMFGFLIFEALLRGYGDTRTPMYLMALGVVLNLLLDPFLILGFQDNVLFTALGLDGLQASLYAATGFGGMGIQGAAIATVASRGVGTLVGLGLLFSGRVEIHVSVADLRLRFDRVRKILDVGAPLSIAEALGPLTLVVLTAVVALAGPEVVAGYGIGNRVLSLLFLIPMAVSRGTETVVGQNLGAEQVARAKRGVLLSGLLAAGALALASVGLLLFAEPIVAVFITGADAATVVAAGADYVRIFGATLVFFAVFRVVIGAFRGSGSTRTAMALSLLALWVFRLPPPYLLYAVFDWGVDGLWYGMALGNVTGTLVTVGWYLRGTWTDAVVESDGDASPGD
jgi:putative MATE family efflux protein